MTLLRRPTEGKSKHGFIWVKVSAAIALGLGTMIGWKRIVVTVGERIGKHYLAYAQGASAKMVAAGTILGAEAAGFYDPYSFERSGGHDGG